MIRDERKVFLKPSDMTPLAICAGLVAGCGSTMASGALADPLVEGQLSVRQLQETFRVWDSAIKSPHLRQSCAACPPAAPVAY